MKNPPNPEIVARLREMITRLALEEADALVTYYKHARDPNADTILKNASRASALFDTVVTANAGYVVLGADPAESLRSAARSTGFGVGMVRRLNELADEIDSVGRGLPSAAPDDCCADDEITTVDEQFAHALPTAEPGNDGGGITLFV